jgi:hypothetical protein
MQLPEWWKYRFIFSGPRCSLQLSDQFHARPLYPWGQSPRYPLDRKLDGLHSLYPVCGKAKILELVSTRSPIPRSYSQQTIAISTETPRLPNKYRCSNQCCGFCVNKNLKWTTKKNMKTVFVIATNCYKVPKNRAQFSPL